MSVRHFCEFSPTELRDFRKAGQILASIFRDLPDQVHAGRTGKEVDAWVDQEIKARGAIATYKTAEVNFPGAICISPNDMVVHGVPKDELFAVGDIVGFDLVCNPMRIKDSSNFTIVLIG